MNNDKKRNVCHHCGSPNYVGGRFGGKCYDCGYHLGNT